MGRVKSHYHESLYPDDDGLADYIQWIAYVRGCPLDEAESLARLADDPAWQREQHADRVAEQAGEDEHSCRDHGRLK